MTTSKLDFAKCPQCGKMASGEENVKKDFGFRAMKTSKKDGTVVVTVRKQSFCKGCRNKTAQKNNLMEMVAITPPVDVASMLGLTIPEAPKMLMVNSSVPSVSLVAAPEVAPATETVVTTKTLTERVLNLLASAEKPLTTAEIQNVLGSSGPSTRSCVSRLLEQGKAKLSDPTSKIRQVVRS